MGKFQSLHKHFFSFLALVACHGSLLTHGRKINIKPLNQHSSLNTITVTNNPQPHLPSLKTNIESAHYVARSLEDSGAGYTDAFRPTTPGGSPGVGHEINTSQDHNNIKTMVVVQTPKVFKHEELGHSPGVGHGIITSSQDHNNMKPMVGVHTSEAFKSEQPDHSPGVGHGIITSQDHNNMKSMAFVHIPHVYSPGVGYPYQNKIGLGN